MDQLTEANKDGNLEVIQSGYNLFKREAENELIPFCANTKFHLSPISLLLLVF